MSIPRFLGMSETDGRRKNLYQDCAATGNARRERYQTTDRKRYPCGDRRHDRAFAGSLWFRRPQFRSLLPTFLDAPAKVCFSVD